ncbi:cytochrome b/b6 domain-containing protein [Methylocystis sp. IM3]|uniref:cytochrome b/b6 domain-containing protein n=1 Tax=unclassified Methylocystis TaxID=2625913 RepID=UPI000F9F0CAA|nr:MAG: cytochrome b/b6 domain-containing protein [Hyphomicrobiales bacterium]
MNEKEDSVIHPLALRVLHWINAVAVIVMILSGWRIYDAAPIWDFEFPRGLTLGGWLAGALAWHFAAMWLLGANLLAYLLYGLLTGHFRRRLLPLSPSGAWRDMRGAPAPRAPGRYNAMQRIAYVFAILAVLAAIVSGLAVWKPVQLQELAAVMGGYEGARRLHFFAMAALVLFIVMHVAQAVRVKGLLRPMVTGRAEPE